MASSASVAPSADFALRVDYRIAVHERWPSPAGGARWRPGRLRRGRRRCGLRGRAHGRHDRRARNGPAPACGVGPGCRPRPSNLAPSTKPWTGNQLLVFGVLQRQRRRCQRRYALYGPVTGVRRRITPPGHDPGPASVWTGTGALALASDACCGPPKTGPPMPARVAYSLAASTNASSTPWPAGVDRAGASWRPAGTWPDRRLGGRRPTTRSPTRASPAGGTDLARLRRSAWTGEQLIVSRRTASRRRTVWCCGRRSCCGGVGPAARSFARRLQPPPRIFATWTGTELVAGGARSNPSVLFIPTTPSARRCRRLRPGEIGTSASLPDAPVDVARSLLDRQPGPARGAGVGRARHGGAMNGSGRPVLLDRWRRGNARRRPDGGRGGAPAARTGPSCRGGRVSRRPAR